MVSPVSQGGAGLAVPSVAHSLLPRPVLQGNADAFREEADKVGSGSSCALGWLCFAEISGILLRAGREVPRVLGISQGLPPPSAAASAD